MIQKYKGTKKPPRETSDLKKHAREKAVHSTQYYYKLTSSALTVRRVVCLCRVYQKRRQILHTTRQISCISFVSKVRQCSKIY